MVIFGIVSDKRIVKLQTAGKEAPPELRLEALIPAAFAIPIGFFWYGWSADKHIHWIMPIIGLGIIGLGMIGEYTLPINSEAPACRLDIVSLS